MWNNTDSTVLSRAAEGGSKATFEAVVAALDKKLTPAEVIDKRFTGVVFPCILYGVARWRTP